ncbi:hypothetical protein EVA_08443 [gut metagenome]|uniref:Uncharacterized protein n=1 Tax=gut metagenome TaxID=749906 RepID=J9GMH6_9ZZZZ
MCFFYRSIYFPSQEQRYQFLHKQINLNSRNHSSNL